MTLCKRILVLLFITTGIVSANDYVFTPIDASDGLSDNRVRFILQLADGRMVFTTIGNINIYDGSRFKYIHRRQEHIYTLNQYDGFYRVYQQGDSLLWIKDMHKLMCVHLPSEKYMNDLDTYFTDMGIDKPVEDFFMDNDQRMWLLLPNGLFCYNTSKLYDIKQDEGRLQDLLVDKEYLYLFYNTGQMICYHLETAQREYTEAVYPECDRHLYKNTSLVVKGMDGFYQLRNGKKGGFFFFDFRSRKWEKILETDYALNTLMLGPEDIAYVSHPNGLWIIDRRKGEHCSLPILKTVDGDIIDTEVSTVFLDKQGGLWLGTLNRGLLYCHPSRFKFSYIGRSYFPPSSARDIYVESFAENGQGDLFLKSSIGYFLYQPSSERSVLVPIKKQEIEAEVVNELNAPNIFLSSDIPGKIQYLDSRGWIWSGTQDGLWLFRPEEKEAQVFYTDDGLANNYIHAIIEDRNKQMWVTTSNGISCIMIDPISNKISFVNYNAFEGTLQGEYVERAAFEASNGTLLFGGINGFNVLKPEKAKTSGLPFKPLFSGLFLRGEKIEPDKFYDGRLLLPFASPYINTLELSHNQNFLTFEFAALNYQNPSQTRYGYRLEDIETKWHEVYLNNSEHQDGGVNSTLRITYTNLAPGKYTLKVMSLAGTHQWDGNTTQINILIHAPWWKTNIAYTLYVLLALLLIGTCLYLYNFYTRKKLERLHKEEILLLRIRNLIDRCNLLEGESESVMPSQPAVITSQNEEGTVSQYDEENARFLSRAIEMVEKNLNKPVYSVEQLSRDLCMDRTGLYRKLIALLDKSPSLFIRSIRLQHAAQLLLKGEMTVADISEHVGFSSPSYMGKCFQEMYGCRPSEYAAKMKNQHSC